MNRTGAAWLPQPRSLPNINNRLRLALGLPNRLPGLTLSDSVRRAEQGIVRYLLLHQDARDTLEGIEKWWLPQSQQYGIADISAALRNLERRGLIRVWQSASAQPIYGRGAADGAALEAYLWSLE
jgi:hypothetical protein